MTQTKERCVALFDTGKRCRRLAVRVAHYHGEHELYDHYGPEPTWVRAALCDKHSKPEKKAKKP